MEVADQSSETHLRYVSLMKAVSEDKNISLYDLKNNTVFLSGPLRNCDYKMPVTLINRGIANKIFMMVQLCIKATVVSAVFRKLFL